MVQKLKIESKIIKFFRFWSSHFKIFFTNWKIQKNPRKFVLLLLLFKSFLDHWKIVLSFFQLVLKSFYFSKDNQKLSFSGYHSVALMLSFRSASSLIFHIKYIKGHENSKLPFKDVSNENILVLTSDTNIVISVVINESTVKHLLLSLLIIR